MDLKQIEYFVRVAELGSFTRASVVLDIAQPALSRQVRLLEVELRQNLLVRNGRGATPTEAGKLLLAHGRGILHQVERAREELGRVRGALAGRVAIGLPPTLARTLSVMGLVAVGFLLFMLINGVSFYASISALTRSTMLTSSVSPTRRARWSSNKGR